MKENTRKVKRLTLIGIMLIMLCLMTVATLNIKISSVAADAAGNTYTYNGYMEIYKNDKIENNKTDDYGNYFNVTISGPTVASSGGNTFNQKTVFNTSGNNITIAQNVVSGNTGRRDVEWKLTSSGNTIATKSLKNGGTFYEGALSDGNYILTGGFDHNKNTVKWRYKFSIEFTIDTTPPSLELHDYNQYSADIYYGKSIKVTYGGDTEGAWYMANDDINTLASFNSGYVFSLNGRYRVAVWDKVTNVQTADFIIDRTDPSVELSGGTSVSGGYAASNVKVTYSDDYLSNATYTIEGRTDTFNSGNVFTDEGFYTINVVDKAGNSTEKTFTIDKTAPVFSVNDYYQAGKKVSISITEKNLDRVELDGVNQNATREWSSDNLTDGTHTITVYDKAGLNTSKTFIVDKLAPTISCEECQSGGYVNNDFTVRVDDTASRVKQFYWKEPGKDFVLINAMNKLVAKNSTNGKYEFYAIDNAGNRSATYSVTLDTVAPVLTTKKKSGSTILDESYSAEILYFAVTDTYSPDFIFEFYNAENQRLTDWDNYKAKTIYFDNREINFSEKKYSHNIFYDRNSLVAALKTKEYKKITAKKNWTSEVTGTIIANEIAFAKSGNAYWLYTTSENEKYIFFDETRAKNYVNDNLTKYISSSAQNYFWYEGTFTVKVKDLAGNETTRKYTIDLTKPKGELYGVKNGFTNGEFSYSVTDNISFARLEYQIPGNTAWQEVEANSKTFSATADNGTYKFRAYDKAGNVSDTLTVILDTVLPTFSVNAFYKSGQTVTIANNLTEINLASVMLDGVNQNTKKSWDSESLSEGSHTITVSDKAGNSTSHTFTVDKTPPVFSVKDYYKDGETVSIDIEEDHYNNATLDNKALSVVNNKASILVSSLTDGTHKVIIYDKAGNSTTKAFTVDKAAPTITINGEFFKDGQTVTINVSDANLESYEIPGIKTLTTSLVVKDLEERTYILTAYDKAKNTATKSFTVDRTPPAFNVNAFYNAKQTITLSIIEDNLDRVELDGTVTTERNIAAKNLADGTHTIVVYDKANNSTSKTFIVDKTAPIFTLKEFYAANETVSLVIEEANLDRVELDGVRVAERSWNADNLLEGPHTIAVYDKAGNVTRADFYFKTTSPMLTVRKNGANASSGAYLKMSDNIEVVINDDQFDYMTFNGEKIAASALKKLGTYSWSKSWTAAGLAEGTHSVIIYDKAKNEAKIQFTVDKTLPSLAFKVNGSLVGNDTAYLNADDSFSFTYSDINIDYVTLDGETIITTRYSASALSEYGHTIAVYDKAGNSASVYFEIDKTAPRFSLEPYYNGENDIPIDVAELNLDYITLDGEELLEAVIDITTLSEGRHTVSAFDKARNSTTKSFIVDKTAPTFTLKSHYNATSVILLSIIEANLDRVTLDGAVTSAISWVGSELPEGEHTVTAYDRANNSFSQTFNIDITVPEISLYINGAENKDEVVYLSATDTVSFTVRERNLDYVKLNDEKTQEKQWSAAQLNDRTYILTVCDYAGNTATRNIVVDKTVPTVTLRKNGKNVEDGAYFKENTTVSVIATDNNLDRIELDDVAVDKTSWTAGELYEGEHIIVVYDMSGNAASVAFVIDKTAPLLPLAEYYRAGETVWLTPIEDNLAYVTLDGEPTSETEIIAESLKDGRHKVTIGDLAENVTVVYFIVDTVAPAFTLKEFYREIDTLYLSISDSNLHYVTLDEMVTELTVWQCTQLYEGEHTIVACDYAGNSTSRSFIVDKTAPNVRLLSGGEAVDNVYFNSDTVIEIDIAELYLDTVTLNGVTLESLTLVCSSLADNDYTLKVVDLAGNLTVVNFVVDKTAPKVVLRRNMTSIAHKGVYVSAYDTVSVVISDTNLERVLFDGVETLVYSWQGSVLSDGTHTVEIYDKALNVTKVSFIIHKSAPEFELQEYYVLGEEVVVNVSEESLDYILLDNALTFERSWNAVELGEGEHTVAVFDKAGNGTSKTFIVDTLKPMLELFKNSKETTDEVYAKADDIISITVSDDNLDYVLFDGEATTLRTWECTILDEKTHFIFAYDKAGNFVSVSFIVDRTAPQFELQEYYLTGETVFIVIEEDAPDGVYLNGERIFNFAIAADGLEECTYILTAYDKAGNSTEKTFTVDLTAPDLTVSGFDMDGNSVVITEGNSYGALRVSVTDVAPYTLYAGHNATPAVAVADEFTVAAIAANEGTWTFYAEDVNGYVSDMITVSVDFTVPTITIDGADTNEPVKGYTNAGFTVGASDTFDYSLYYRAASATDFSLCSQSEFTVAAIAANEGAWEFYAVDVNGLQSITRRVVLDLAAPVFDVSGLVTETDTVGYTNTSFTYTATDYHFATITYKLVGGDPVTTADSDVVIENTKENEGTWQFYAVDSFGQKSATYSVVLNYTFDFKNVEDIRNSFKQNTWYTVTLPSRIYGATSKPDISGTYTFADYNTALEFAIEKERDYRVYEVNEGGWGYVSVNNENVYINYQTEDELSAAISHYAVRYVSTCKRFNRVETRNTYPNLTNAAFESDASALTSNSLEVPEFLSEYGLPLYFARQSFVPINNAALSTSKVTLTYVGNLIGAVEHKTFDVAYRESFATAMSRAANLYEGYYLFEESDLCGNVQSALLFIDLSEPTICATIIRGDGEENITITKDTVGERSGVIYAVSFSIRKLLDNMDGDFISVQISGADFSGVYTVGDDIPELNADFGSGEYTINAYDRSFNSLTFNVIIAGRAPTWSYTSLSANSKKLSISISKNDRNNALLSLRLVKIRSDGTFIDITEDSEGTPVTPANSNYVLIDGGKYSAIMTDMYGRTIETTPIFYEKGLPSVTIVGVKNGGITASDVQIAYSDVYGATVYSYVNGIKTPLNGVEPVYVAEKRTYTVTINRAPGVSVDYLIFVYTLADEGIYIEYTFTIDNEAPLFIIEDDEREAVAAGSSINKPFAVSWLEDNVTAKVKREGYNFQNYEKGSYITVNALYTFILSDKVGNETQFTVYLDSEVSYELSGAVTTQEENYVLTRNPQRVTIKEEYVSFSLTDENGKEYTTNDTLDTDGYYALIVIDIYGNELVLNIEIDMTPPSLTLENVKENGLANKDVTIKCDEDNVVIETTSANGATKDVIANGAVFEAEGKYYVKVTDRAGNSTSYSFTIDKTIAYSSTAENGLITTSEVKFSFAESVVQSVARDGEDTEPGLRYIAAGSYIVMLKDDAGNEDVIEFTIIPKRHKTLIIEDTKSFYVSKIARDGAETESAANSIYLSETGKYEITLLSSATQKSYTFSVEIDNTAPEISISDNKGKISFSGLTEKNVNFVLYKDGEVVDGVTAQSTVSEKGKYTLVLTDDVGNTTSYEFEIKFRLNAISIVLIALGVAFVALVIVLIIRGRRVKAA